MMVVINLKTRTWHHSMRSMGGKVCLTHKGKTLLGVINKPSVFKSLLTSPSNPQVKFSANNLNFH